MTAERVTPATIEMFKPFREDRSAKTNSQLVHLMGDFFGRGWVRLYRGMKNGDVLPEDKAEEIDSYVLSRGGRNYDLPERSYTTDLYMQWQKEAIRMVEYFGEILPEVESLELKDEISLLSDRPSDLLRLLSRNPDAIDPVLAYEVHRHPILTHMAGMNNARTLNGRLRTCLSDMHHLLNEKLFEGPEGAGKRMVVESIHDDETNQVVGLPNDSKRIPPTAHLKRIPFTVRRIPEVGLVYTSPRKKDDRIAMVKAIAKAKNNDGVINVGHDVQDPIGMMFVLIEDRATPEQLADQVVSVVEAGSTRFRVEKIEKDDLAHTDHGQSSNKSFDVRRLIWYENIPVPVELMFSSLETYLNSRLEVGIRDSKTGLFMGRAHQLFDLRRAEIVAPVIFPKPLYPEDVAYAFANRSKLEAQGLRGMYKAA